MSVEDRLLAAWRADTAAQREELLGEIIVEQLPLARRVAMRYRERGQPLEDLVQVASMALVLAVQRYRPGAGQNFEAYAVPTIVGELRRSFREQGWAVRPPRRLQELRPRVAGHPPARSWWKDARTRRQRRTPPGRWRSAQPTPSTASRNRILHR